MASAWHSPPGSLPYARLHESETLGIHPLCPCHLPSPPWCAVSCAACAAAQVDEAIKKLEEREREAVAREAEAEAGGGGGKKKRGYNSLDAVGGETVTPEEMEAWRLKKSRPEDPMEKARAAAAAGGAAADGGYDFV